MSSQTIESNPAHDATQQDGIGGDREVPDFEWSLSSVPLSAMAITAMIALTVLASLALRK